MTKGVGYRKPPPERRFKAGQSGNPKGRPKNSLNFLTLLDRELKQPISVTENGKRQTITRLAAMTKRLVAAAMSGDYKAMSTLVDILRKSGKLEAANADTAVVENYGQILDSYVAQRMKSAVKPKEHGSQGGST
jgi:hypothetical protein